MSAQRLAQPHCGYSRVVAGNFPAAPGDLAGKETAKISHVAENIPATTRHYPQTPAQALVGVRLTGADRTPTMQPTGRSEPHAGLTKADVHPFISRHIAEARAHWWGSDDALKAEGNPVSASEAHEVLGILQVLRSLAEFSVAVCERSGGSCCYQCCSGRPARLLDGGLMARRAMSSLIDGCSRVFGSLGACLRVVGSR